ncbi:hypothetical protein pipiens_019045, partial [Culex pipiens pipiens]
YGVRSDKRQLAPKSEDRQVHTKEARVTLNKVLMTHATTQKAMNEVLPGGSLVYKLSIYGDNDERIGQLHLHTVVPRKIIFIGDTLFLNAGGLFFEGTT